MADLITTTSGATFNVYYEAENRQKRLEWVSGTATVNDLYTTLQDLFDTQNQMDDGTPMSAQTPTAYTIGIIDTGDDDPWFIDDTTAEKLTGGAIETASWTRVQDSNTGIVKIEYTDTSGFTGTDIGKTVTNGTDSGTLLDYNDSGTTNYAWIRPDDDSVTHNWDSTSGAMAVTSGTATPGSQSAAAVTGEALWANIFTIGTIADNTHIYIEQNDTLLTAAKATTDWWSDGQIDILVKTKAEGTEIDEGVIVVFARQLTKTYSYFETDLSTGGATAIPLGTGTDLNAAEGVRQTVVTTASGDFTVGEVINDGGTKYGVITSNSGTAPNLTLEYYLIGDPLSDFVNTDTVTGATSTETATIVTPTDVNSGALAGVTFTYSADSTIDVDENDTNEDYSIVIDPSDETLEDVYQYAQYITRRGNSGTTDTDGKQGQFYRGLDYVLTYTGAINGALAEGAEVTQETSGAQGIIVALDTTNKYITLRNSRGTFATGASDHTLIEDGTPANNVEIDGTVEAVAPNAASPFGTFAGGIWFLARGVVLDPTTVPSGDAQNFRSVTNDGTTVTPPNKVTVEVSNLRAGDAVSVHRLTAASGIIEKDTYAATVQTNEAVTLVSGTAIDTDEPGKTAGGTVVLVGDDENTEYPIRYSSWSGSTFTLASKTVTCDDTGGTTSTTNVHVNGSDFLTSVSVGDLVLNSTESDAIAYVTEVTDNDNVVVSPAITGMNSGDTVKFNVLPIDTTTADSIYVPLLYRVESTGTDASSGAESTTLTFGTDIPALVRVRNAQNTVSSTTPMIPYAAEVTIGSNGLSNAAIRTKDSISSAT